MATGVNRRATESQMDQHPSRDLSELHVLSSKIHLVSLKLNLHRIKSVDEAQTKTDTKVSEKQHHDKMKEAHFKLELTLRSVFILSLFLLSVIHRCTQLICACLF